MTSPPSHDRPALLGGTPLRPGGPPPWPLPDPAVAERLADLAASGDWGRYQGPWCQRLADRLAEMHSCRHVWLCSSGTVAGELALRALRIGPGDEVLLAAYDFKANFTNVLHVEARPVLVDVRPDDWQLDVGRLDAAWRPQTKAVIASHLHGGLVDMATLRLWADRRQVAVIEDACQAPGALVQGRPAGAWGDVGVWSFGGSKLTTAGRGGALFTNRDDVAQRVRLIALRGNDAYPLSEMQAAVLLPQIDRLPAANARRRAAVQQLTARLAGLGLTPLDRPRPDNAPVYYKLGWQYDPGRFEGLSRDRFAAAMRAEGMAVEGGFRALHLIHARGRFRAAGALPAAEAADAHVLTLHHPILLGTEADLAQLAEAVERVQRHAPDLARAPEDVLAGRS